MPEWLTWLATPISGAVEHAIPPAVSWHARLMVLGWGLAVPGAVLLARYFKVTPGQHWPEQLDNPFWWNGHRVLNYGAVLMSLLAVYLVWGPAHYAGASRTVHAWLGWAVVGLAALQIAGAWLRGTKGGPTAPRLSSNGRVLDLHGDHYDMTPRRLLFERVHKSAGYAALLLAMVAITTGLWTADALRWMWIAQATTWALMAAAFVRWQRQGRCLDTYQAIWGPGLGHPGSSVRPVGPGIRRVSTMD